MDPSAYFIVTMFSLALIYSMIYNTRRLETIGYALSIVFLQQLIAGDEDVFLICPQFPLYVSPKDKEPTPDETLPDSEATGVYVDHVLLLPRATLLTGNRLSLQLADRRNRNLWTSLHITSLEVPLLEERKRAPTRHPSDLDDHIWSIFNGLNDAEMQVVKQAKILLSSPRFASQDTVVLVASSGEYYRLGVLERNHYAVSTPPVLKDISDLLENPDAIVDKEAVAQVIRATLVSSPKSTTDRQRQAKNAQEAAEKAKKDKERHARDARSLARSKRKKDMAAARGFKRELYQLVDDAGDPTAPHRYSDVVIEKYCKLFPIANSGQTAELELERSLGYHHGSLFFAPMPSAEETVLTLSKLRRPDMAGHVVFTGVIRVGSPVSDKYFEIIRRHLSSLARSVRLER